MTTMVHQRPRSPPSGLHPQLQHLVYANANGSYGQDFHESHGGPFIPSSQPASLYNSPALNSNELPPDVGHAFAQPGFDALAYPDLSSTDGGLGIQYSSYGAGSPSNYYHTPGPGYDVCLALPPFFPSAARTNDRSSTSPLDWIPLPLARTATLAVREPGDR